MNFHDMSPRDKIYFLYMKVYSIWWEPLHLRKKIFVPRWHVMKIHSELSILEQFLTKAQILIFRVAIFTKIQQILSIRGTLIKKIISDSPYLWLKTMKSEICFSGFPKKACQGCHISQGASTIFLKIFFCQSLC